MSLPRLLVIDDNPDFGGHQVMAAYALEGMVAAGRWELLTLLHPENTKNHERLGALRELYPEAPFTIDAAATRTGKFQALRRYAEGNRLRNLAEQITAFNPDLILVIQGNIEQGCSIFHLQGQLPCPLISYIPVPHRHAEMGAKLGSVRDWTCRGLYAVPDGFITISQTLGDMLLAYGARGRIQIVENGIPLKALQNLPSQSDARAQFSLPQDGYIWGQIGRIEFKQKGQDCALQLFLQRETRYPDEHLVFLGSGPDDHTLQALTAAHPRVHCLPWTNEPAVLYAAINALILPSRYEGVPLAMLEALASGLPVAATDRDGMRDWLPASWRFPYRNLTAGQQAMDAIRGAAPEQIQSLQARVLGNHSVANFQQQFNQAIDAWLSVS
ncbi:glycosyltransferase family 4 protein [Coraliomargarita sp. SDUM461004]|uniref:Glycosyltransferase family 4 protein n=1 Tax=Thalassobacterium sedimentorum TaxID=3041258 RepID=A0ABU1AG47_9BACT|nr:glycosyltransferase family 4 protein [Coraliomargarita sp. SDUM461004]MDQ8193805.1 glycosyltransferase family 4 protein [Coraliomargarita sp. SDUM461004]